MRVTVIDTETTSFEGSVVEIAGVNLYTAEWHQSLVKPEHPISFGAMATHLITEEMVADAPDLSDAAAPLNNSGVYVAHNAEFDKGMLPGFGGDAPWICTYRCALHLMPDAETHRNIALCFEAGLDVFDAPKIPDDPGASMPHRALFDSWATRKLLLHLMELVYMDMTSTEEEANSLTFDDLRDEIISHLILLTKQPALLRKVRFGKHEGELWEDVPSSYLRWVCGQDFDEDVLYTANFYR